MTELEIDFNPPPHYGTDSFLDRKRVEQEIISAIHRLEPIMDHLPWWAWIRRSRMRERIQGLWIAAGLCLTVPEKWREGLYAEMNRADPLLAFTEGPDALIERKD